MASRPQQPLPPELVAALQQGKPIEAVKLLLNLRANGGLAPKTQMRQQVPPRTPLPAKPVVHQSPNYYEAARRGELSPGEVPRSTVSWRTWIMAALLLYAAYRIVALLQL